MKTTQTFKFLFFFLFITSFIAGLVATSGKNFSSQEDKTSFDAADFNRNQIFELSNSVDVKNSAELQAALSDFSIHTIYLKNDIVVTNTSMPVNNKRIEDFLVIDGYNPDGPNYTLTEYNSNQYTNAISIESEGTLKSLTLRNMNIIGKNYYGTVYVPDANQNFRLVYDNISYIGPQITYNRYGTAVYRNSMIQINNGYEVAEIKDVVIEGNVEISKTTDVNTNKLFWIQNQGSFTVSRNANLNCVSLSLNHAFFYIDSPMSFRMEQDAKFSYQNPNGIFFENSYFSSFEIGKNAEFFLQTGTAEKTADISPSTSLIDTNYLYVGENATLNIQALKNTNIKPLVIVRSKSGAYFNNPKRIYLFNSNSANSGYVGVISFSVAGTIFKLEAETVKLWDKHTDSALAPNNQWTDQGRTFRLSASATTQTFSGLSTDYPGDISTLTLSKKSIVEILGRQKFSVKYVIDDQEFVENEIYSGSTYQIRNSDYFSYTKNGYDFKDWIDNDFVIYQQGNAVIITSDLTLTARWNKLHTITYHLNDGSGKLPVDDTQYSDSSLVKVKDSSDIHKDGFLFVGWNTRQDGRGTTYQPSDEIAIFYDIELYAMWSQGLTVTYHANGAEGNVPQDNSLYADGSVISLLGRGQLMKAGFIFIGWSESDDNLGKIYGEGYSLLIKDNLDLYAVWQAEAVHYGIKYDANGGLGTLPVDYTEYSLGAKVLVSGSNDLSMEGYTFHGWSLASDGSGMVYKPGENITITGNMTLYAIWSEIKLPTYYHITYDSNGASGNIPVDHTAYDLGDQALVSGISNLSMAGHTFLGWNLVSDGSGTVYKPGDNLIITGNMTLYAIWSKIQLPTYYHITYDSNGALGNTPVDNSDYSLGAQIFVSGHYNLSKEGHVFLGWSLASDGSGTVYKPGDKITVTGDMTFYAIWSETQLSTNYHIIYNSNGAQGDIPIDHADYSSGNQAFISGIDSLSMAGHTFLGWSLTSDGSGTVYKPGDKIIVIGDMTLYAIWSEIQVPTYYHIIYDLNGAQGDIPVDLHAYISGEQAVIYSASGLSRPGYNFVAWNTSSDGTGITYHAGDRISVESGIKLYAIWEEDNEAAPKKPSDLSKYLTYINILLLIISSILLTMAFFMKREKKENIKINK